MEFPFPFLENWTSHASFAPSENIAPVEVRRKRFINFFISTEVKAIQASLSVRLNKVLNLITAKLVSVFRILMWKAKNISNRDVFSFANFPTSHAISRISFEFKSSEMKCGLTSWLQLKLQISWVRKTDVSHNILMLLCQRQALHTSFLKDVSEVWFKNLWMSY